MRIEADPELHRKIYEWWVKTRTDATTHGEDIPYLSVEYGGEQITLDVDNLAHVTNPGAFRKIGEMTLEFLESTVTLRAKMRDWRDVAVYLANCHAANAAGLARRSVSKSEKRRLLSVITTARDLLGHGKLVGVPTGCTTPESRYQAAVERLSDLVAEFNPPDAVASAE